MKRSVLRALPEERTIAVSSALFALFVGAKVGIALDNWLNLRAIRKHTALLVLQEQKR